MSKTVILEQAKDELFPGHNRIYFRNSLAGHERDFVKQITAYAIS